MKILYTANQAKPKIPNEQFHNEILTTEIQPSQEFKIWLLKRLEKKDYFTFCDYPFIM